MWRLCVYQRLKQHLTAKTNALPLDKATSVFLILTNAIYKASRNLECGRLCAVLCYRTACDNVKSVRREWLSPAWECCCCCCCCQIQRVDVDSCRGTTEDWTQVRPWRRVLVTVFFSWSDAWTDLMTFNGYSKSSDIKIMHIMFTNNRSLTPLTLRVKRTCSYPWN